MRKIKSRKLLLAAVAIASIMSVCMTEADTSSVTKVSVISIFDETYVPGSPVVIYVNVTDVTDLYGFNVKLKYDPNLLTATDAEVGSFFPDFFIWKKTLAADYVWFIATRALGAEGGISGSGTIAMFHFTVNALGGTYLELYDTEISDSFAVPMDHDVHNGYFSNVPTVFEANLVRRSAWPESHHYVISKDADGYVTLNSLVKNIGTVPTKAKVNFTIYNQLGGWFDSFDTATVTLESEGMATLTFDWDGYTENHKYSVEARCWYDSDGDGVIDATGAKLKTFRFAVVP